MFTLIEALANPGQFSEPARPDGSAVQLAVGAAAFALVAIVAFAVPSARRAIRADLSRIATLMMGALCAAVIGIGVVCIAQVSDANLASDKAHTAYSAAVGSWLKNEYGIKTSDAEAESAALGNKLATLVDDSVIVVHLIDVAGGDIALVDADDKAVRPAR